MNILFLCTANMHRSRTAEDFFKSLENGHVFQSAGLSKKYCAKYGSRLCCIELLDWAEKIFVMEPQHLERIIEHVGERYLAKIEVLHIDDIYQYMQLELLTELASSPSLQFITR
tara:strand:- start:2648 stop:2989 length:342 start_codon:yes stop_codon:yes gene_type:complete